MSEHAHERQRVRLQISTVGVARGNVRCVLSSEQQAEDSVRYKKDVSTPSSLDCASSDQCK